MKVLYIDCGMGAAGDMLSAALLQLVPDPEKTLAVIKGLNIPDLSVSLDTVEKCGISGAQYRVKIGGAEESDHDCHHGHHLGEIRAIIDGSGAPNKVCADAKAVYDLLARAESKVHGCEMEHIHFHEVGTIDAIVDILTVCLLINELAPDRICASAVHVGQGTVKCAHGVLPVPAPATAELLCGIPIYSAGINGELCTPTGAALLRYFVDEFGGMPDMIPAGIGCGMGKKDFPRANCLRVMLGDADEHVLELCCNVDDMSGEAVGFALEKLMEGGALDACWEPIGMKKSRPGMRLSVMCRPEDREKILTLIFKHTSSIGVRETLCRRYVLKRGVRLEETPWGPVRVKESFGYGVKKKKPEFDDLSRLAAGNDMTLQEVSDACLKNTDC